jgi:glutamyl-Q tRNA(Asp) synthetase
LSAPLYIGRFAPSPTGPLHFGSLVAALASYADARHHDGQWLLRIEDVDEGRTQPGAIEAITTTLSRYGFQWDGPIEIQSQRKARYQAALTRLNTCGATFICTCTRKQLEQAPLTASGERLYPGTCRTAFHAAVGHHTWRVRVPDETINWHDHHYGPQTERLAQATGDFVVKRADGLFAYQLAVVVDDAAQGITHVVRGADLLSSTARQIYLQRLLGVPVPAYLHVPVIVNNAGEKLSKQTRAAPLAEETAIATLLRAWDALGQSAPQVLIDAPKAFFAFAAQTWDVRRIPRVPSLRHA